jgi:hypothetical protein
MAEPGAALQTRGRPIQPRFFFPEDPREGMLAFTHCPIIFSPGMAPIETHLVLSQPRSLRLDIEEDADVGQSSESAKRDESIFSRVK